MELSATLWKPLGTRRVIYRTVDLNRCDRDNPGYNIRTIQAPGGPGRSTDWRGRGGVMTTFATRCGARSAGRLCSAAVLSAINPFIPQLSAISRSKTVLEKSWPLQVGTIARLQADPAPVPTPQNTVLSADLCIKARKI